MSESTTRDTLAAFDQELRRHIGKLLEISCDDGEVANLIYDAIQNAAQIGRSVRSLQQHEAS